MAASRPGRRSVTIGPDFLPPSIPVSPGGGRMARTTAVLCVGVLILGTQIAAAGPQAGRGAQRGAAPRPAAPAPQAPATPPQVTAIAIRVVGPGLGANGSELQPFHESPGTAVALAVQASRGSGIVE